MRPNNVYRLRPQTQHALVRSDAATIRAAARQVASGVSVITVGTGRGRAGLTALSVSLLSADPPTLVLCVHRASAGYAALVRSSRFAVNVLGGDQREIAEHFAGVADEAGGSFDAGRFVPIDDDLAALADCAAVFECEKEEIMERRANAIVIGAARRALIGGGSGALVRWRGVYDQLGWSRDEISRAVGLRPCGEAQERP
jgi:flavin reductase (DIM6/NTAB) family NADH-FMN oxidoreductase RutF